MQASSSIIKVVAIWLLALMLAAVAFIVTVGLVNTHVYGPQQQVRDYFAALRDGDGATALGLLNATVPESNPAMLDGAPLKEAVADLSDLQFGEPVALNGGRVQVSASYSIDGTTHQTPFTLKPDGTDWLFFDRWVMEPRVLPTIDLSVINEFEATLNGERVGAPGGQEKFAVFLPGEYESHYTSEYFAAPAIRYVLTDAASADDAAMALITAATPKLIEDVQAQIDGFLNSCTAQKVLQPAGCPLSYRTNNRVNSDSIKWSIEEYPVVSVSAFNGAWVMKPLEFTGRIEFVQTDLFSGKVSTVSKSDRYAFAARLNVAPEHITVTPVVSY